jgi:hypothetical protein
VRCGFGSASVETTPRPTRASHSGQDRKQAQKKDFISWTLRARALFSARLKHAISKEQKPNNAKRHIQLALHFTK